MAEIQTLIRVNRDRQGHLLAAHSGGHRVRPAQSYGALTTREETMTGTWRWPKLNSRRAIGLRPRITTSTPNIISDRCPRTKSDTGFHIRTRAKDAEEFSQSRLLARPILKWGQRASLIVATRDYIVQRFALVRAKPRLGRGWGWREAG